MTVARASGGVLAGALWVGLTAVGSAQGLPAGKAKPIVQRACTTCHELVIGSKQRMDRERWAAIVEDMVERGAKLSEEETAEVIDYFAANFGPAKADAAKVNINRAASDVLVGDLGLSPREAAAIVKFRDANGPFKDLPAVKKVPGLDPAKIDALKDRIEF